MAEADVPGDYDLACDFCHNPGPEWLYPCEDFPIGYGRISRGAWMACAECARLVDKGWVVELLKRVRKRYRPRIRRHALEMFMARMEVNYLQFLELKGRPYRPDEQEMRRLKSEAAASREANRESLYG